MSVPAQVYIIYRDRWIDIDIDIEIDIDIGIGIGIGIYIYTFFYFQWENYPVFGGIALPSSTLQVLVGGAPRFK